MSRIDWMDKIAAKWQTNLNRWQAEHDPVFEMNHALVAPYLDMDAVAPHIKITWEEKSASSSHRASISCVPHKASISKLSSFAGFVGNLHFLLTPPLEYLVGPLYVERLFTVMQFGSKNCVSLINEYYKPVCRLDTFVVTDEGTIGEPVRRLYLRECTTTREEDAKIADIVHDEISELHGFTDLIDRRSVDFAREFNEFT